MQRMWYYTYVKKTIFCITDQQLNRTHMFPSGNCTRVIGILLAVCESPVSDSSSSKSISEVNQSIFSNSPADFVSGMHWKMLCQKM